MKAGVRASLGAARPASLGAILGVILAAGLAALSWPDSESEAPSPVPVSTVADAPGGAPSVGASEGQQLPDFLFRLEDGSAARLSDYRGRAVFINVWATWCNPCVAELPMLDELFGELADEGGVQLFALSVDSPEIADKELNAFARRVAPRIPLARDPDGGVARALHTASLPVSLLIDKQGVVRQRLVGMREWTQPRYAASLRALASDAAVEP